MNDWRGSPSMLALVGDLTGPALWRILQPIDALERRGYACGWDLTSNHAVAAIVDRYDGVILPRLSWSIAFRDRAIGWLSALRRRGQLLVFEADDDLFSTAMTRRSLSAGLAGGKTLSQLEEDRRSMHWLLGVCDGVTVSTEHLAGIVRRYTDRPVVVVPNAIDLPWFRSMVRGSPYHRAPDARAPTIGWAGGQRDESDLAPLATAWGRVAARYPGVRFVVAGHPSPSLLGAVPSDRLAFRGWLPIERYPANLAGLTIGCCALDASDFNRSKSNIKALEYAAAGAAVVASPTVYGALIEHGRNGLIAETADDWERALSTLVERPSLASMLARRLLRDVERRCTLAENLWRWPAAWARIAAHARGRVAAV